MNILLIEDDSSHSLQIEAMLSKLDYNMIGVAKNFEEAIDIINLTSIDLVLLDVGAKGDKRALETIALLSPHLIPIVLTPTYDTQELYDKVKKLDNVFYLVKPFHIHTLDNSIRLLKRKTEINTEFIRGGVRSEIIALKNILYIEVERTYSFIQTENRRYAFKKSLTLLKKQIPVGAFIQIHRSFLVNKKYIKRIDIERSMVELEGGVILPMSRRVKHLLISKDIKDIG
ncbi:LytTR family DNA-binding domain-containing protein [Runella sp. MFBS21]|uniref:LytR/AlgR family response regulator transcription factor n=1 Tax=Runella sp. MFBS21 TaxID=3034018 RepID=UPI0023F98838|nr:LytTR family DNA-binding domain-containing protein [Runella sp. MFBS21]MDF7818135.1 LytTR family DNA-binding domain-containing protein [Runella sp. MFBS21]